jgi:glycosyltransferase involved in cell wall biosynthesis
MLTSHPRSERGVERLSGGDTDGSGGRAERQAVRVAILADLAEERWTSMDLVADTLVRELPRQPAWPIACELVRPPLVPVLGLLRSRGTEPPTADRVFNRFWLYRRALRRVRATGDVFHIVDHSYAHLALALPAGRTVVTCHDIDTFRGFFTPGPIDTGLPRFLVKRLAAGLRRAAFVVCPSHVTANELTASGLADGTRLAVVPNGVETLVPSAAAERESLALLTSPAPTIDLLHVGSAAPRKRLDLLLHTFARVAVQVPRARLVRVGGPFTPAQESLAGALGIRHRILVLPFLQRETLLALYRNTALLLMTSDREGFGLPVVEALSAGIPVVARDLPVLREVGGEAVTYLAGDDPETWSATVMRILLERQRDEGWRGRLEAGRLWASRFAWSKYAATMALVYAAVASKSAELPGTRAWAAEDQPVSSGAVRPARH